MPDPADDFGALAARIREGDDEALALLLQRYESEVRRAARALLGPALRPYLDSIDIAQSVHLLLLTGLREHKMTISTPEKLVSLAALLVRRRISFHWQRLRRQQRLETMPEEGGVVPVEYLATERRPSVDPAAVAEARDQMRNVLDKLSTDERKLVELRLEGLSTAEVGRRLDLDPAVLRVRLSRLRQRLRDQGFTGDWL
jgi:RNA polymerase sigma-70 factor (ECF subfamily)